MITIVSSYTHSKLPSSLKTQISDIYGGRRNREREWKSFSFRHFFFVTLHYLPSISISLSLLSPSSYSLLVLRENENCMLRFVNFFMYRTCILYIIIAIIILIQICLTWGFKYIIVCLWNEIFLSFAQKCSDIVMPINYLLNNLIIYSFLYCFII